jgi:hypothetical protein
MSYPTIPAYIQSCKGWELRLKEHPVMDWMFDYENAFDFGNMKSESHDVWHTSDFYFTKSNGTCVTGGAEGWAALLETYAPFSEHFHEPMWLVIFETPTGYELCGQAKVFANLHVPGEKKKTDLQGRKWDIEAPGAFHFEYVKDHTGPKGLKMKGEKLYADGIPMVGEMIKRGMVTAEQALGQS